MQVWERFSQGPSFPASSMEGSQHLLFRCYRLGLLPTMPLFHFEVKRNHFNRTTVKDIESLLLLVGARNQCTLFQVNKWQKSIIFNFQLDILVFTYQGESDGFLIEVMQLHAIKILPSLKVSHWLLSVHSWHMVTSPFTNHLASYFKKKLDFPEDTGEFPYYSPPFWGPKTPVRFAWKSLVLFFFWWTSGGAWTLRWAKA